MLDLDGFSRRLRDGTWLDLFPALRRLFPRARIGLPGSGGFSKAAAHELWVLLTLKIHPPAAILYSTVVVPFLVLIGASAIRLENRLDRWALGVTILMVTANNAIQIQRFREALLALSS